MASRRTAAVANDNGSTSPADTVRMSPDPTLYPTADRRTTLELANLGSTPWLATDHDFLRGMAKVDKEVVKAASETKNSIENDVIPLINNLSRVFSANIAPVTPSGQRDYRFVTNTRRQLQALEAKLGQVRDTLAWISKRANDSQQLLVRRLGVHNETQTAARATEIFDNKPFLRQIEQIIAQHTAQQAKQTNKRAKSLQDTTEDRLISKLRRTRNRILEAIELQAPGVKDPRADRLDAKLDRIEDLLLAQRAAVEHSAPSGRFLGPSSQWQDIPPSQAHQDEFDNTEVQAMIDAQLYDGQDLQIPQARAISRMDTDMDTDSDSELSGGSMSVSESEDDMDSDED